MVKYFAYLISSITLVPWCIPSFLIRVTRLLINCLYKDITKTYFVLSIIQMLLIITGSVETNPGPFEKKNNLSFAVWNLDSLPAREFARVPLIKCVYSFDLFGICESMLTDKITNDEIYINGFSSEPFRADKADNIRNGGVCLYFKESLPIKQRADLQILPETIVAEVKLKRKKIFFVLSYRHPNMASDAIDTFMKGLENIYDSIRKENPYMTILFGDFNARSPVFLGR